MCLSPVATLIGSLKWTTKLPKLRMKRNLSMMMKRRKRRRPRTTL